MKAINITKARLNVALEDLKRIASVPGEGICQTIARTCLAAIDPVKPTPKRFPRGKCPICGRVRSMNKFGWLRSHAHDGEAIQGIPVCDF